MIVVECTTEFWLAHYYSAMVLTALFAIATVLMLVCYKKLVI